MKPRRLALAVVVTITAALVTATPSAASDDQRPDLAMRPLTDIHIEKTSSGRRLLRFTTVIVNIGSGPFEARGAKGEGDTEMTTTQRVYDSAGGFHDRDTEAVMFFAGDDHFHWHVRDLESSELIRVDNGVKVGTGEKRGFCFFDNVAHNLSLPAAPQSPIYRGCGNSQNNTAVTMGLSVGWGDRYPYYLKFQYIDITGLSAGRYNLVTVADESDWFVESNETNNGTAVEIQLTGHSIQAVTGFPVSTTIKNGTRRAGNVGRLAANDDSFFEVNSTSGATFWYGRFTGIPNRLTNLRVHYSGKSSLNTTQLIRIWNFRTGSWTTVDSRSVGSSEVSLTALPGGTLADYVSGGSGDGDLRIGVRNRRSDSRRFFASGDELSIVYDEKQ